MMIINNKIIIRHKIVINAIEVKIIQLDDYKIKLLKFKNCEIM